MINNIYISSYQELIENINKIKIKAERKKIFDELKDYKLYFRGQANVEWELKPNILRSNFLESEQLSNLNGTNEFNRLAIAQHYGHKTRCLDFTRNFKIALYFVCNPSDNPEKDGALYIIDAYGHRPSWFTNILANYVSTSSDSIVNAHTFGEKIAKNQNIINEFERTGRSICDIDEYIQNYLGPGFLVDFEGETELFGKYTRILKQEGALFYFGSRYFRYGNEPEGEKNMVCLNYDELNDYCYYNHFISLHELNENSLDKIDIDKLIIPQYLKKEIFKEINISAKDLGLED